MADDASLKVRVNMDVSINGKSAPLWKVKLLQQFADTLGVSLKVTNTFDPSPPSAAEMVDLRTGT